MRVLVTGAGGLLGSVVCEEFTKYGNDVVGYDNDFRGKSFTGGSVAWRIAELRRQDIEIVESDFCTIGPRIGGFDAIVHCAGQPSHDFSVVNPRIDFYTNSVKTFELLELCRTFKPDIKLVFMSTNKVYGDLVNKVNLIRIGDRFVPSGFNESWVHPRHGVSELCPIDGSNHTPFGVSKLAADLLVQEYARTYSMKTAVFRCGCITGSSGSPVEMHGFLGYLAKCAATKKKYTIYGYDGCQVRDNINAKDLASAIYCWVNNPRAGVYNMGGGYENSISVLEAIQHLNNKGYEFPVAKGPARFADHAWWISDTRRFANAYPDWWQQSRVREVLNEMVESARHRGGASK